MDRKSLKNMENKVLKNTMMTGAIYHKNMYGFLML